MRISYSGLDTFSTCPAKYKFQYIDRIRTPRSKEAAFGTLIHECLKVFHDPSQPTPLSEDNLLKCFTEKWDNSIYQDTQEEAFAFHQGIEILKNYYVQNQGLEFNIINLEMPFEVLLSGENKQELHQVTGRIDRIDKLSDNSFEIIDYKTSKKMPSQESIDNNLQLSIYYLGIINRWPSLKKENRPVKLSLCYLRHGEKLSTIQTNQQIKQNKQGILSLIDQIQQSSFESKTNPLCDWCQYQPYCPLYKHKYIKKEQIVDEIKIKDVIKEFFEIKEKQSTGTKRLSELKDMINKYCDANQLDRVFSDQGHITRLAQKRFSYDAKKLREILEPLGKWNQILTVDKTKFKKIVDSLPSDTRKQIDAAKTLEKEFKVITMRKK